MSGGATGVALLGSEDADASDVADDATAHAFLNCYLRETGAYEVGDEPVAGVDPGPDGLLRARLPAQEIDLLAPLSYRSPTERHLFETPIRYRLPDGGTFAADAATLATLIVRDLAAERGGQADADELLLRVLQSERAVASFVAARVGDARLDDPRPSFREAEQSLVFGHHRHPTPKSRNGMTPADRDRYAPELAASFPLHYFAAAPELVTADSALERDAGTWIADALREDPAADAEVVDERVERGDVLLPVHPWQAEHLLEQPRVRKHLGDGLEHLGPLGGEFAPTTSVRTLYSEDAPFMVKSSLSVQITNAERTNKRPELERGVAVAELLDTEFGTELDDAFPDFDVVRDPAYVALDVGPARESGLETILRENPFRGDDASGVAPLASLCQDGLDGPSRLARIVRETAEAEGRTTDAVGREWFRRYLERCLRPVLWLYLVGGVGVEAHQQNVVLSLDEDGYPDHCYYRDNQGYYFPESQYDDVDAYLPGVGERADTVCADAIADERLRYYVILNNALDAVNAFGVGDLVAEGELLELLREELERARERYDRPSSSFLDPLLASETVPCKANLLTRFRGLDELENDLENQSVYADVRNPIVTETDARAAGAADARAETDSETERPTTESEGER